MFNHIRKSIVVICLFTFISACDKGFEELNTNPVNPTETTYNRLFAGYLSQCAWNYEYWANNSKNGWMNWIQLTSSTANRGRSNWNPVDRGRDNIWEKYYLQILQTYRTLENQLKQEDPEIQAKSTYRAAVAKIIYYFYTAKVTDLYGSIPFEEAGLGLYGDPQIYAPRYQSQEEIYKTMLEDLKDIGELLSGNDPEQIDFRSTEEQGDIYYSNSWEAWERFANSLRLRYAMRLSEVDPTLARQHVSEILDGGLPLILTSIEDALWDASKQGYLNTAMEQAFVFDEAQGQKTRASNSAWYRMADGTTNASIFDVRATIFFTPNAFGQWAPIPNSPLEQENQNITLDPLIDPSFPAMYSLLTPDFMGSLNAPERHFLTAETFFLMAEAYHRGWAIGDAQTAYENGILGSVDWYITAWNNINFGTNQISYPTATEVDELLNNPKNAWDASRGLELIMTQKWLDFMLDPLEAYSEWRRTGFPVREQTFTTQNAEIIPPVRFKYPLAEAIDNSTNYQEASSEIGGDDLTTPVWWDK